VNVSCGESDMPAAVLSTGMIALSPNEADVRRIAGAGGAAGAPPAPRWPPPAAACWAAATAVRITAAMIVVAATRIRIDGLEIGGSRRAAAVPILDRAVHRLQEAKQAAIRSVAQHVAARLHRVARLHVLGGHALALQLVAARGFERPDLRVAALR